MTHTGLMVFTINNPTEIIAMSFYQYLLSFLPALESVFGHRLTEPLSTESG